MIQKFDLVYLNLSKIKGLKENNLIVYEAIKEYGFCKCFKQHNKSLFAKKIRKIILF